MLKKTLKVLSFLAILSLRANANDLLANISNDVINDSSLGVKVLNTDEMNKVVGGYIFYRYPTFDFQGGIPSYAYLVADDSRSLSNVGKAFGLSIREVVVVKERYLNGSPQAYLQSYNFFTSRKTNDLFENYAGQQILNQFKKMQGYYRR